MTKPQIVRRERAQALRADKLEAVTIPPYLDIAGKLCADARPAGMEPEDWYPLGGTLTATNHIAIGLCGQCPALPECFGYAMETGQRFGIWGATWPARRVAIAKKRRALGADYLPPALAVAIRDCLTERAGR